MKQVNLKYNILLSGSFRVVVMVISFITSVLSARYLGVTLKGQLSYLVTISGFIWMVMDLGLYRSFPYLVRKHPDKIGSLYKWIFIQFLAYTSILLFVGYLFITFFSSLLGFNFNFQYLFLFVLLITTAQTVMQLQSLYLGLNKIWQHSIAQLLNALIMLLLLVLGFILLKQIDRLYYLLLITVCTNLIIIFYYIVKHNWNNLKCKLDWVFTASSYKSGFRVFLSTLFIILLIRFDIVIIKRMLGYDQVGIYSIAAHLIDLLQVASNVVGGLLLVKLSDNIEDVEKWKIMKKLLMSFFVMLCVANLGFIIFGRQIISLLYGQQFVPVYYVYLWLIPASFGLSFGSLFNMYLNSKGFPVISIILPAVALSVNIMLNFLMIPVLGISGSAIATSIAYLLWFIMIILYEQYRSDNKMFKHLIPNRADWSDLWQEGLLLAKNTGKRLLSFNTKLD